MSRSPYTGQHSSIGPLFDLPAKPRFNGADYVPKRDDARLTGQLARIYSLMADGQWRTLAEIAAATGDPESSISAQLRHLRKPRFGSHVVERQHRGDGSKGLYEYRVEGIAR